MMPAIEQTRTFKATPAQLYELFMDSRKHAAATGAPAKISRKPGGRWAAHNGMIFGKNLLLVANAMIVQTWRAKPWKRSDLDSILIVQFSKAPGGARVELTHVGVPEHDYKGVSHGWPAYYWAPWKKYLAKSKRGK